MHLTPSNPIEASNFVALRNDFPILHQLNRGKPLIYLDTGASAQKPKQVIDAVSHFYLNDYANVHRGIYELSERATARFENARLKIKTFINAAHKEEIIFTRGTTESINLVAQTFGRSHFVEGDEVIVSGMEHHANLVPWQMLQNEIGITLKIIPVLDDGSLDLEIYSTLFSNRTKLVAITHASNVLGVINPVKDMIAIARNFQVPVLIDGAQAVSHFPVDVQDLDCDFYAFSSHKLYGPAGVGVLYGKLKLLEEMPPYQGGGHMIEQVSYENVSFAPPPYKFEAGTHDLAGVIGFDAALDYLERISMNAVFAHDQNLLNYAEAKLGAIEGLRIIGTAKPKIGILSLILDGAHPHDISTVLDNEGIAIRAGHHCAMPLMSRFNVPATARVSFGLYNQEAHVGALEKALLLAKRLLC